MELQDENPQWKVLPQVAQLLLDHRDDLDEYEDEFKRLAYRVACEHVNRQAINHLLADWHSSQLGGKGGADAYSGTGAY